MNHDQVFLLTCLLVFLLHCSPKGENSHPVKPIQALPDYDLEATSLEIRTGPREDPTTIFRVDQDVWVSWEIKNLGLQPVGRSYIAISLRQDDKIIRSAVDEWGPFAALIEGNWSLEPRTG